MTKRNYIDYAHFKKCLICSRLIQKLETIKKIVTTDRKICILQKAKVNHPGLLPEVVELIAELKGMGIEECGQILFENGKRLLNI